MKRAKVLFVCVQNSARSQMAEAWLNQVCGENFKAESAGLEPGVINPLTIEVLNEVGIDVSNRKTQSVFELFTAGRIFKYVITVCDEASGRAMPNLCQSNHSFPLGLSRPEGGHEERLQAFRNVRDAIRAQIEAWCEEVCPAVTA